MSAWSICPHTPERVAQVSCPRGHDRELSLCLHCLSLVALGEFRCPACELSGHVEFVTLNDSHALPAERVRR